MKRYHGNKTREIRFPLGGIGTGCIGLGGDGRLLDFEIFNSPNKGSQNGYTHFAMRCVSENGKRDVRVLNGDYQGSRMGVYLQSRFRGYGFGPETVTMAGFPHFRKHTFCGDFPFARVSLFDPLSPCKARVEAFNPFIPGDSLNSSLPAAFFSIHVENVSAERQTVTVGFSFNNPYPCAKNHIITLKNGQEAVLLRHEGAKPGTPEQGEVLIAALGEASHAQESWYRGGWMDGISTFWREFSECDVLPPRHYDNAGAETATVTNTVTLAPGEKAALPFVVTWYHPVCQNTWDESAKDEAGNCLCWRNFYATRFSGAKAVAEYCIRRRISLERKSRAFSRAMAEATMDETVKEAALSNLSVLKSPTVLRLEDGTLWGWEGCHEKAGSCEGTCTHVWNYAYALCYLFPDLERSIRNADYRHNLQPNGAMRFRLPLPKERPSNVPSADSWGQIIPCADGQLGGVIKVYREWKLSGDTEWMKSLYPSVKSSLLYATREDSVMGWDRDRDGVLEGRQHHTLDMELFGPSGWLEGFYLGALEAGAQMAEAVGDSETAAFWRELYQKGRAFTEEELFNGKYYGQKVNIRDRSILEPYGEEVTARYWNAEKGQLKYQIGDGCAIDQLCGQWHAHLCGLGDLFDPVNRKIALQSLYCNNFTPSVREECNCWRNYAINDEGGAVICSYPNGAEKPVIPLPYADERMHGFEYQLAGLLVAEGMLEEGLSVVKSIRDRYDGEYRNPYNEMECGSNYARSMASFALLPLLGGFTADMTEGRLSFAPVEVLQEFAMPVGFQDSFCKVKFAKDRLELRVLQGRPSVAAVQLTSDYLSPGGVKCVMIDGEAVPFTQEGSCIRWERREIRRSLEWKI